MNLILKAHMLTQKLFASLSLTPIHGPHNGTFQQGSDHLRVMTDGDPAQGISYPSVSPFLVLQSEFKGGQHTYPPIPCGIKVWGGKDICQQIVVSPYHKQCVCEILFKVLSDTPLEGKECKFRAVVVFL